MPLGRDTLRVLAFGAALTTTLTVAAAQAHDSNEDRLLAQRAAEVGAVLEAAIPAATAEAHEVARVTELQIDDVDALRADLLGDVGDDQRFATITVERLGQHVVDVGAPSLLPVARMPELAADGGVNVTGVLRGSDPRLIYTVAAPQPSDIVVHAEQRVRPDEVDERSGSGAFDGIRHAIYLGETESSDRLVTASTTDLPIEGRRAALTVPFGDETLRVVVTPSDTLGGSLLASLPWLTAGVGLVSSVVGAVLVEGLHRRRADAEAYSAEVRELYRREHAIAHTLQHSLLPDHLERLDGLEVAARYFAGAEGADIGGDWYDVVNHDGSYTVVVGDVVGRGVKAAAVMAAMRYATHALSGQRTDPAEVIRAVNSLEHIRGDFVTMLCGSIDPATRTVRFATAGHPAPLLIAPEETRFLQLRAGPPIGFLDDASYTTKELTVPPDSVLVLFTDGLYERPDETIDQGLDRLLAAARETHGPVDAILDQLAEAMLDHGLRDDTAMLAVRVP